MNKISVQKSQDVKLTRLAFTS